VPEAPTTDLERALAFQAATSAACADEVREHAFGRVLATPSLPLVYSLNVAEVRRPGASLDSIEAALPDAPRPGVLVVEESEQERLRAALDGWDIDDELTMLLGDSPEPPPPGRVREATREEIDALQRQWLAEDFSDQGAEALGQLSEYMGRQWTARPTRAFCSPEADAMTLLWQDGDTAQVEDVYTRPDARNRGHARALVSHVAALARSEGFATIFLIADAVDTPRQLYEKLGFEPAARALRFTRPAQPVS
jgi:GNAT superfamily N-acetyltransferase